MLAATTSQADRIRTALSRDERESTVILRETVLALALSHISFPITNRAGLSKVTRRK